LSSVTSILRRLNGWPCNARFTRCLSYRLAKATRGAPGKAFRDHYDDRIAPADRRRPRTGLVSAADGSSIEHAQGYVMRHSLAVALRQGHALELRRNYWPLVEPWLRLRRSLSRAFAATGCIVDVFATRNLFRRTSREECESSARCRFAVDRDAVFMLFDTYGFPPSSASKSGLGRTALIRSGVNVTTIS